MTTIEVLRGMRRKVEQGWTQGSAARSALGGPVSPLMPDATCWCIYGAAIAAGANIDERLAAYAVLKRFTNGAAVDAFNDLPDQTRVDVLAWIDRAVELAEREAA